MKLVDKRTTKKVPYEDLVIGRVYEDSDGDILFLTEKSGLVVLVESETAKLGCTYGDDAVNDTFIEINVTLVLE